METVRSATRFGFQWLAAGALALVVLVLLLLVFANWRLSKGPVDVGFLTDFLVQRAESRLEGTNISLGPASIARSQETGDLELLLKHVSVQTTDGRNLFLLPQVATRFSIKDAILGQPSARSLTVSGAAFGIQRQSDGNITLFSGQNNRANAVTAFSVNDVLRQFTEINALQNFAEVSFQDIDVTLTDITEGKQFEIEDGDITLRREGEVFELRSVTTLTNAQSPKPMITTLRHRLGDENSNFSLQFDDIRPRVAALDFPQLAFLSDIDAPISGSITAEIAPGEPLGNLDGVLELGAGDFRPDDAKPLSFSQGKIYFSYIAQDDLVVVDEFSLTSELGRIAGTGNINLLRDAAGSITSLDTVLDAHELRIEAADRFPAPVLFTAGQVLAEVDIDPFAVNVEQLVLWDEETHFEAVGRSWVNGSVWQSAYGLRVDLINKDRLLDIWPQTAISKTRRWIEENVSAGTIANFRGSVNAIQAKPDFDFSFALQDVSGRFVKALPIVQDAQGEGRLTHETLTLDLASGYMIAPNNVPVNLSGTKFHIPDITERPARGEISLSAKGSLQSALTLLDVEKFQFLTKAGAKKDMARGRVAATGEFRTILKKGAGLAALRFDVDAELTDVSSDKLVKGKNLKAKGLRLKGSDKAISLNGDVTLDGTPAKVAWRQALGKSSANGSSLNIDARLNRKTLAGFGVVLPDGMIDGEAPAKIDIQLTKGAAPKFELTSALKGLAVSVPALGWRKGRNEAAEFVVKGQFGQVPKIDDLRFSAPGLKTSAKFDISAEGKVQSIEFSDLTVGDWLKTNATLSGIAPNKPPNIVLSGGRLDLRRAPFGNSGKGAGGSIRANLDQLVVTKGITLTNFSAALKTSGTMTGSFSGNVNGKAPVKGAIGPSDRGLRVDVTAVDAGRTLRAANLFTTLYDGELRFVVWPNDKQNSYNAQFLIERGRLKQSNALAALVNAVSGVGLLQQLNGEGIHFNKAAGKMKLEPSRVQLLEVNAVGPSMGITANGWYTDADKGVDFEGVVTPFYVVNGVFERVFRRLAGRQKGEGLFGFTYRMRGPAAKPKVLVNPLSILTPGVFREIFRQPVPKPQ